MPDSVRDIEEKHLEALVEVMFLAAWADGEFNDDERRELAANVEALTEGRASGPMLIDSLARIERDVRSVGRDRRLLALRERLPTASLRETALSIAIRMVAVDGVVRAAERDLVFAMAGALDVDRETTDAIVDELVKSSRRSAQLKAVR